MANVLFTEYDVQLGRWVWVNNGVMGIIVSGVKRDLQTREKVVGVQLLRDYESTEGCFVTLDSIWRYATWDEVDHIRAWTGFARPGGDDTKILKELRKDIAEIRDGIAVIKEECGMSG